MRNPNRRGICGRPASLLSVSTMVAIWAFASIGCGEGRTADRQVASEPEDTVTVLYYSADPSTWTDFGQPVLSFLRAFFHPGLAPGKRLARLELGSTSVPGGLDSLGVVVHAARSGVVGPSQRETR